MPEDETLSFADGIGEYLGPYLFRIERLIRCVYSYRQFSSPANLAGKPIISNKIGANILSAYQAPFPALSSEVKKAYSGGTSQLVIHGATYSWSFPETNVSKSQPNKSITYHRHHPIFSHEQCADQNANT